MKEKYSKDDKMYELLADSERLLQVVSRFDVPLGVGEKTIEQICNENSIDTQTFLAIVNFTKTGGISSVKEGGIDLKTLCSYLLRTHTYMLNFFLPHIRRHLIDALGSSESNDVTFLIIKFFDEYCSELKKHMETEEKDVFSYVDGLIAGGKKRKVSIEMSGMHRSPIEQKLSELKNIIIKYYQSSSGNDMIYNILQHLFICEYDLYIHDQIENYLFLPEVKRLENLNSSMQTDEEEDSVESNPEELTEREKEIIKCVVKGLTNKETADKLFISVNTVTTHRRNIAKPSSGR